MQALTRLWKNHRLLVIGFSLASMIALVFLVRLLLFALYWQDPDHRNQPLEAWMTLGYVAHSYDIPRHALFEELAFDPTAREERPTLAELAEERGVTFEVLEQQIIAAIEDIRRETPRP